MTASEIKDSKFKTEQELRDPLPRLNLDPVIGTQWCV